MTRILAFRNLLYNDSPLPSHAAANEGQSGPPQVIPDCPSPLPETPLSPRTCACGNPIASNVQYERLSGMCDSCIEADPDAAYESYTAALESYYEGRP